MVARVKLALPDTFHFTTDIQLRVTDINYGGHLGNDAMLSLAQEARARLFAAHGFTELNVEGLGTLMVDAVVVYRSEAFYGETIVVDVAVCDFTRAGCDFVFRFCEKNDGREVARVKTGIAFLDYETRKIKPVPPTFKAIFED